MLRPASVLLSLAIVLSLGASGAWAQASEALSPTEIQAFRGPGYYLSTVKILLCWGLFLAWIQTSTWVNYDCQRLRHNYALWNSVVFFPLLAAFVLLWLLPSFAFGFALLILAHAVPLGVYIWKRNKTAPAHDQVLTPGHLRFLAAGFLGKFGVKIATEKRASHDAGPPVKFIPQGAPDERTNQVNLLTARDLPGFVPAKEVMAELLDRKADALMLDFSAAAVTVRHQLDGVWHEGEPRDRVTGDALLEVLKRISGLNPAERRAKQEGKFGVDLRGATANCKIITQGVERGERAMVQIIVKKLPFNTLEELGFRPKTVEQLKAAMLEEKGLVLFSGIAGNGVTTTIDVTLKNVDRFLRDFVAVEDEHKREREIENVHATTYNSAAGETPATVLPKLIRKYPNVYVVRDLVNEETIKLLLGEIEENRLIVTSIRAKDSVEALVRMLMMKAPPKEFAKGVHAVLSQRLIRKLCEKCKTPVSPPLELVKQLGMAPGQLESIYQPPVPNPEKKEKICPECGGIGYRGRTAISEFLPVNDEIRTILVKSPKIELLRPAARKAGLRSMQEEGLLLVAKGTTSLAELQRVLKQ